MQLVTAFARVLVAWLFVRNGLDVLRHPEPRAATASWLLETARRSVPTPIPQNDVLLVQTNALLQIVAAALFALGQQPRIAALALAGSMVPTTLGGHPFWRHDDPARRAQQQIHFDKNLAIIGGLLLAAVARSFR
jgi:uncharacterized membrane protein YphA (DoxX/SURF4 family)